MTENDPFLSVKLKNKAWFEFSARSSHQYSGELWMIERLKISSLEQYTCKSVGLRLAGLLRGEVFFNNNS